MIRITALAHALLVMPAAAHHDPSHKIFAIGVETKILFAVLVCDTEDAVKFIMTAHRERGISMAIAVIAELRATRSKMYEGEPLCGTAQGFMTVHEQLAAETLPGDSHITYLVRISMHESPERDYYALISVDEILPANRADELMTEPA